MEKDTMDEIMEHPPVRKHTPPQMRVNLNEGDNSKIMNVNVALFNMEKVDLHDAEAVQKRLSEYFQIYAAADLKPTVAGMGMALGLDRRRLWEIRSGQTQGRGEIDTLPQETRDIVKRAYMLMENMWETYMNSGKINPVSGIFLGKNNFGYQDKTEYVVTPNVQQERDFNEEDIRRRYLPDSTTMVEASDSEG